MFHKALGDTWIITGQIKAPQGSRGSEETFTLIDNFKNVHILHSWLESRYTVLIAP